MCRARSTSGLPLTDVRGSDVPDLVQALQVMLCALSLALANGAPARSAPMEEICKFCGADVDRVEQLRQSAFDPLVDALVRAGDLRVGDAAHMSSAATSSASSSLSATVSEPVKRASQQLVGLLSADVAEHNINVLRSVHRSSCGILSFDDAKLISEAGESAGIRETPARNLNASSGKTAQSRARDLRLY